MQLAETLGIAQQTMAHYEGGVSRIAVETLTQLAVALQTNVEELIGTQVKHRPPNAARHRGFSSNSNA